MEFLEGQYQSADFEEYTLTIEIDSDFKVYATDCIVVPTRKLSMQQKMELINYLENL